MIPGLEADLIGEGKIVYRFGASVANADLHALIGAPTAAIVVDAYVPSGVEITSSDPANAALDLTGFPDGSTINLYVESGGAIIGAGGAGGDGTAGAVDAPSAWPFRGGGGGGGFGNSGGAGGTGAPKGGAGSGTAGTDGVAGTDSDPDAGGAAGANGIFDLPNETWSGVDPGGDGGDCILATGYLSASAGVTLNIDVEGSLYPGGGGGAGGYWHGTIGNVEPGDGGGSGEDGLDNYTDGQPGSGGRWIVYSSNGIGVTKTGAGDVRGSFAVVAS